MIEHPMAQDFDHCAECFTKEKEAIDAVQKEYDDLKAHINAHTISSLCGSRESHNSFWGACWKTI